MKLQSYTFIAIDPHDRDVSVQVEVSGDKVSLTPSAHYFSTDLLKVITHQIFLVQNMENDL